MPLGFLLVFLLMFLLPRNAFAQVVTVDRSVTVSAQVGSIPSIDPGGGGGGGIPPQPTQSGIIFSGYAYPGASITVLKLRTEIKTVVADEEGYFTILVPETKESVYTLVATDILGYRSVLLNFPVSVYAGYLSTISDIRFPPTIRTSASASTPGESVVVEGAALPTVPLELWAGDILLVRGNAGPNGEYSLTARAPLTPGDYFLSVGYTGDSRTSVLERLVVLARRTLPEGTTPRGLIGDFNGDGRVNIIDFSIMAYWYQREEVPAAIDLSKDGVISLKDFSILVYHWTE